MRIRAARDPWEDKVDPKKANWRSIPYKSAILRDLAERKQRILKAKRPS
jgi:hypothetical protein